MKADPADIMSAANPERASVSSDRSARLGALRHAKAGVSLEIDYLPSWTALASNRRACNCGLWPIRYSFP